MLDNADDPIIPIYFYRGNGYIDYDKAFKKRWKDYGTEFSWCEITEKGIPLSVINRHLRSRGLQEISRKD